MKSDPNNKQEHSVNSSDETQAESIQPPQPVPTQPQPADLSGSAPQLPKRQVDSSHPNFVDGQFHPLDPRNVATERISLLILWAIFAIAVLVGIAYLFFTAPKIDPFLGIVCGIGLAVVVATGLFSLLWPKIEYKRTSFKIDPVGIEIHQGVLWRSQICVPIGRVQHADVGQGPLQRMFGVSTLTLHTAGTSNASVEIEGLDHAFAVEVRDWIVHQRKNYDAV